MKNGLLSYMGNFQPALMSLAQSTTGMSAPQMSGHVGGIPKSLLSNFFISPLENLKSYSLAYFLFG